VPIYYHWHLLPEACKSRFPFEVRRADLIKLLHDPALVDDCFETARLRIVDSWDELEPPTASVILGSIEAMRLWSYFDRDIIKLSETSRQILSVRFDVADMIYEDRHRRIEERWLEREGITERLVIARPGIDNEPHVLAAFSELVMERSRIDLAFVSLARVPETAALMLFVKDRLQKAYEEKRDFLRKLLKHSTFWKVRGEIVLDFTGLNRGERSEIARQIEARLQSFKEACHAYVEDPKRWRPSIVLVSECKTFLVGATMPEKPETTYNWTINAPVGVISVEAQATIGPINQNLRELHDKGAIDIGTAISELTKHVIAETESISSAHKAELLEHLELLSGQAVLPPEQRKQGVVRSVTESLAKGLTTAGALAEAWDKWGDPIRHFFGV